MAVTMAGLEIEKQAATGVPKGLNSPACWSDWNVRTVSLSTSVASGACTIRKQVSSRRRPERSGVC